jgi:Brinker DNA-binding domain/Tc5 transposase DNA-binding domain
MSSDTESQGPTPSKRRTYDLKFKLEVVEYAEEYGKHKAATKFKVDRASVRDWTKQKEEITVQLATRSNAKTSSKNLKGAGRPLKDREFDEKMINWVRQQRQKKLRVSRTTIQKQALTFSTDEEFKVTCC